MKFLVILAIAVFVVLFLPFCVCVKYSYDIVQAKYEYNGERCNLEKILDTGDSYIIKRFPPEATAYYPISPRGLNPEECTLLFESGDDCILEYRTHHFERGDIYCNEQYFRIGDENAEIKVCGFNKPPSHLSSSGKQLFLTHYSANEHGRRTVASYLSGTVHCIPNKVNHLDTALSSNAVTCLTPLTELNCFKSVTTPFKGFTNATYVGVFGGNQFTVRTICTTLPCSVTNTVCFGMQNVTTVEYQNNFYDNNKENKNCTPPLEPPFMGEATDGCVSLTIPCTRTGDCSGSIVGTAATTKNNFTILINGDNATLPAEPTQLGSLIFNACSGNSRGGMVAPRRGIGRGGRGVDGRNGGKSSNILFK